MLLLLLLLLLLMMMMVVMVVVMMMVMVVLWARQSHALVELERGPTRGNPLCKAESRYATLQARGR